MTGAIGLGAIPTVWISPCRPSTWAPRGRAYSPVAGWAVMTGESRDVDRDERIAREVSIDAYTREEQVARRISLMLAGVNLLEKFLNDLPENQRRCLMFERDTPAIFFVVY